MVTASSLYGALPHRKLLGTPATAARIGVVQHVGLHVCRIGQVQQTDPC